ncbi:hypothetical protein P43SY_003813 [Pythium insidiosum]|uniref:Uncharacterized protein n=1 Tax=Pythium insidiosum TaxID=114742 RepID=A0AAD5Q521_PYTIN|nr:hypothetical protein P43SY_003813 [Pythium insidiosum]
MSFILRAFLAIVMAHFVLCYARYRTRHAASMRAQAALKAGVESESSDQQQLLEKIRMLNARIEQLQADMTTALRLALQADMTTALRLAVCEEIKFNARRQALDEALAASKCEIEELKAREQEALAAVESWKTACWQRIARLEREMMVRLPMLSRRHTASSQ